MSFTASDRLIGDAAKNDVAKNAKNTVFGTNSPYCKMNELRLYMFSHANLKIFRYFSF